MEDFCCRVHKAMNVIQTPLVIVFVALVIVLLYAAMLLPIYQNMEVHETLKPIRLKAYTY